MCIVEIHNMDIINYFHQQNNDERIKSNEDQDFCFVVALKRAVLNGIKSIFLELFVRVESPVSLFFFFWLSIKVNRACVVSK